MNIRLISLCTIASIMVLPPPLAAQELPELLIPVDKSVEQKFKAPQYFSLRDQLYIAKPGRYHIVTINFDLLDKEGAVFTITPFPGTDSPVRLTVRTLETSAPGTYDNSRVWAGLALDPAFTSARELDGTPVSVEQLQHINRFTMRVRWDSRDVPPMLRRELLDRSSPDSPRVPMISNHAIGSGMALPPGAVMKMSVRTLSGEYAVQAKGNLPGAGISIYPVGDDPRYHVVYEKDNAKLASGRNDAAKLGAYGEFKKALDGEQKAYERKENATLEGVK
jgi:hypothetical protein